ncbi:MAG: hypothetical protein ACOZIN_19395, partial [Myxococcota bacterium]
WDTPEAAYSSFSSAVQRQDFRLAYQALSAKTRKVLETRAVEISKASGGAVRADAALLLFTHNEKPAPLTEVKVLHQKAGATTIAATSSGQTREVQMVYEEGRWKVDLADHFKE